MNRENKKNIKILPTYYYYNEEGLIVFTEEFHISRGHCCGNKCLNCPYIPRHTKGCTNLKKENT